MSDLGPRWGGVAHGLGSLTYVKSQEPSAFDFRTLQDQAGSSANDTGTCRKSGTPLTQPAGGSFPSRSRLESNLRIALDQYPLKSEKDQEIERGYLKRDLERLEAMR